MYASGKICSKNYLLRGMYLMFEFAIANKTIADNERVPPRVVHAREAVTVAVRPLKRTYAMLGKVKIII
jgi:hypothetical protein